MIRFTIVAFLGVCGAAAAYTSAVVAVVAWRRRRTFAFWRWRGPLARRLPTETFKDRCGIYLHLRLIPPIAVYIGQSTDADGRMVKHGNDIRSLFYRYCMFFDADPAELNDLERALIRLFPWCRWLGFNRTRGGS